MLKYKFYATLLDAYNRYASSESDNAEQELIDKINRVPFTSEAASKGTAFNELVDDLIEGKQISTQVTKDGFDFTFDYRLLNEIAESLSGSVPQYLTSAYIETRYGLVEIYGYMDYLQLDEGIDLKCTGSFEIGKYRNSMQRHVYPYCLFREGAAINQFTFLVTDYKGIFRESYTVDLEESEKQIRLTCESLIEFLNSKKHLITDQKVFAKEAA